MPPMFGSLMPPGQPVQNVADAIQLALRNKGVNPMNTTEGAYPYYGGRGAPTEAQVAAMPDMARAIYARSTLTPPGTDALTGMAFGWPFGKYQTPKGPTQ